MPPNKPRETQRYVYYADGHIAKLENVRVYADKDTYKEFVEFEIKPTDMLRWAHNIEDNEFDVQYNTVKRSYPKEFCHCLDHSPLSAKWFILSDYTGKKTDFMNTKFINPYLEQIKLLSDELKRSKFLLARMSNEMKIIMKHPNQAHEHYLELMDKTRKVLRPREQSSMEAQGNDIDGTYDEQN